MPILSSVRDQAFESINDAMICATKRANRKGSKRTQYIWQLPSGVYIVTDNQKVSTKPEAITINPEVSA